MTNEQIKLEVDHIFQSGANEARFCNLLESVVAAYRRELPHQVIAKYRTWKATNPNEDYQYDEIHEFLAGLSRSDLVDVMESLLAIEEK